MAELSLVQGSREWESYRERALTDLFWFCDVVLGYGQQVPMTLRAHYLMCRFAERQTGIPALDDAWVRLIKVPRGVGKSTLVTQGYALQMALKHPDIAMLIINETERGAAKFLSSIKQQITDNEFLRALFPERCPTEPEKECRKWSESEIVLPGAPPRKESTMQAIGVGGSITGLHPDHAIVDDMISDEAMENARAGLFSLMDKTNRWISRLRPIVNTGQSHFGITFIGCLTGDSRVLMEDGRWKPIKDIKVGERVYSWNPATRAFAPQRVTGVYPQGEVETVVVDAGRYKLQCTPDHPFLAAEGRHAGPVWRKAENLMKVLKKAETIRGLPERPDDRTELPGWGPAEPDLLWLLGFLWGDGWLTKYVGKTKQRGTTYSICFAQGTDEALNERVRGLLVQYFGNRVYDTKGRVARSENNRAGRLLESWGLTPGVGAKNKRLPAWLLAAAPHEKREFLMGLLAADGHDSTYRGPRTKFFLSKLSTASKGLAEDVRDLALTCGVRPTKVWHRHRTLHPPQSPEPVESDEYTVSLRFEEPGEALRRWGIKSVTPAGKAMVYDLSVEGTENYVAEGFVVHNTPWWEDDSYTFVEKAFGYGDSKTHYRLKTTTPQGAVQVECYRVGDLAVFNRPILEHGTSWFPERWPDDKLAKMRVDDPLLFAANMMLDPRAPEITTFKSEWRRYYQWADLTTVRYSDHALKDQAASIYDLDVMMSIDPAFTEGGRAQDARQAIVVTGGTVEGYRLLLMAQATRQSLDGFIADIVAAAKRFKPKKLRLEKAGQQAAFNQQVRRALTDAGVMTSVLEETPGSKNKDARIESLSPYFERGLIYAQRDQHDFWREYDAFPRGKLKDILDALSAQITHWRAGTASAATVDARVQKELNVLYTKMGKTAPVPVKKDWRVREDGSRR